MYISRTRWAEIPKILPRRAFEAYCLLLAVVTSPPNLSMIRSSTYARVSCFTITNYYYNGLNLRSIDTPFSPASSTSLYLGLSNRSSVLLESTVLHQSRDGSENDEHVLLEAAQLRHRAPKIPSMAGTLVDFGYESEEE